MTQESPRGKILLVDDEPHQRLIMSEAIKSMGYDLDVMDTGEKALEAIRFGHYDVLVTDMQMPGMDGIQLLQNTVKADQSVSVIVVTAHGTIETAVDAMKKGAEDFVTKPVEFDDLEATLKRVFKRREIIEQNRILKSENEAIKSDLKIRYHLTKAIGKSPQSKEVLDKVQASMKTKAHALILGDPGSGQEEIARMIHFNSPWAENPLLQFDCIAVPLELQEAQLFGEEASRKSGEPGKSRPGIVERAHTGTLILSNLHRLHPSCQPRLSGVLREEKTQRTNGTKFYPVYVKIISTSSTSELENAVGTGQFKKDLYELLLENAIRLAPLHERKEDIPILIAATAKRFGETLGKAIDKVDREVVEALAQYDFPGDSRELEAMVETAVIRCQGSTLKAEDFSFPAFSAVPKQKAK